MKKALLVAALLTLAANASHTSARAAPIGSSPLWEAQTTGLTSPARYYAVLQEIVEYDATCRSATRFGQATFVLNVLEGQLTVVLGERKSVYQPGQTAVVPPRITYWFGNEGKAKLRFQESIITPAWAGMPQTLVVTPTCPGRVPTVIQRGAWSNVSQAPAVVDMTQQGAELDPGYASPRQTANAFNTITVVSGEVTLRYDDGTSARLLANQAGGIDIGKSVVLANDGTARASYIMTWVAAPGAALTSASAAAPASSSPSTGIRPSSTVDAGLDNSAR